MFKGRLSFKLDKMFMLLMPELVVFADPAVLGIFKCPSEPKVFQKILSIS
jgi:hypothetical protein